jgi:cation:H+ antiporter
MIFALFAAAAMLVWWAGRRLPALASALAGRTGIGKAFVGMLLLGGITSLPELATTSSAAAIGAETLALNNVLGTAAFNILLLVAADAVLGRNALTAVIASPATLLQGVLGMLLLSATVMAMASGELALPWLGVGAGSSLLFLSCIGAMWIASRYETRPTWVVVGASVGTKWAEPAREVGGGGALAPRIAGLAFAILVGGLILSLAGEAIARRTGAGEGLVGVLLLAVATSLPELSVITAAVRRGDCELAVGDVFGANLFNVAMIFVIDLVGGGGPLLRAAGAFEAFAALLALVLTGLFVLGLLERHDRTALRMGYDSIAAVVVYGFGLAVLIGLAA